MYLQYFRIYSAIGVYNPEPSLDVILLSNNGVVVRLLGAKSYESVLDGLLTSSGKRLSDLDDEALRRFQPTRNSYLMYGRNNAILYISAIHPISIIDIKEITDEDGPNFDKLQHRSESERAFGATATALSLSRFSKISKDYEFIIDGYNILDDDLGFLKKVDQYKRSKDQAMMEIIPEEIQTTIFLSEIFHSDKDLQAVIDLFSGSLKPYENGFLHAFISAWTGLEIFIVKQFKVIQMSVGITVKGIPAHGIFSKRMLDVMNDKYRLLDKFAALSNYLNESGADEDISLFQEIKTIRDRFFHNMSGAIEDLPLDKTRDLLEKYLKLYLVKEREAIGLTIV